MAKKWGGVLFNPSFYLVSGLVLVLLALSLPKALAKPVQDPGEYVRARFLAKMKQAFEPDERKKMLIIGDSHAQDFYNGILENGFLKNYQISTRYIPTRCQIYLGEHNQSISAEIKPEDRALCEKSDNLYQAKAQIAQADVIILVASWRKWSALALKQTLNRLHLDSSQRLFVIGRKSFRKAPLKDYQHLPRKALLALRNPVDEHQTEINRILRQTLPAHQFIDIHQLICGHAESCPVFTDHQQQISFDGGHFSKDGARYITRLLFEHSPLGQL